MMLAKWTPTREMAAVHNHLANILFDTPWRTGRLDGGEAHTRWNPVVDIYDDGEAIVIAAELPGIGKEDISIDVKDRVLTLKGERSDEKQVKEENVYRKERVYGSFERAFSLPDTVDIDMIRADFKDGVLNIAIPKAEKEQPKQITIH